MSVFEQGHQKTIDQINVDGWTYLALQSDRIAGDFDGRSYIAGDTIYFAVNDVRVFIEQAHPRLEWTMPHLVYPYNEFSQGFRLSVNASSDSRANIVICNPIDWYMLCLDLHKGLNMAQNNIAAKIVADAQNR